MFRTLRIRLRTRRGVNGQNTGLRMLLILGILILAIVLIVNWIGSHARPVILQMAQSRVIYLGNQAINDSVREVLSSGNYAYDSLVHFEKDVDGKISALKSDMIAINSLKVEITDRVLEAVENLDTSNLTIPLGNIMGADLFWGRGPGIPVKILPLGHVRSGFSNHFEAAGINQTRHEVIVTVEVDLDIVAIGASAQTTIRQDICVAETLIVGVVPESYLNVGEDAFA